MLVNNGSPPNSADEQAYATAVQSDGKVLVAGTGGVLVRYTTAGALDTSFAGTGKVVAAMSSIRDVAVDSSGKILVAGTTSGLDFAVARYTSAGVLDTTFGTGGIATVAVGLADDYAMGLAIDGMSRIVVAGYSLVGSLTEFSVARYTSTGQLDTTFGNAGTQLSPFGSNPAFATDVAVDSSNRVIVVGYVNNSGSDDIALARYTSTGVLDTAFGASGTGEVVTSIGAGNDQAFGVKIAVSGRIVVAGSSVVAGNSDIAVLRYTTAGVLDTTFGGTGIVVTAFGAGSAQANAVTTDSSSRVLIAGFASNGANNDFAILRYTSAGALDTAFNQSGEVLTPIGSVDDVANAIALNSGGTKIAVAGAAFNGTDNDFAVAQYVLANTAPKITSNGGAATAAVNVPENTTAVTTVTGSDVDLGQTLTYSISGGADSTKFAINSTTGALSFASAPNFELPTDSDKNNVYNVTVQVSDGTANVTQAIAVTVTNVIEPVSIVSNGGGTSATVSVPENTTAVTTVVGSDPDFPSRTLTYSIFAGGDGTAFSINPSTGVLSFANPPDFEAPTDSDEDNVYDLTVQTTDGSTTASQTLVVTVTDVLEAATITSNGGGASASIEIPENTLFVSTVTAVVPDAGQKLVYSIVGGADAAWFMIDPSAGTLSFCSPPDFEAPTDADANGVYNVIVKASDGGPAATQALAVTVTNVNETTSFLSAQSTVTLENTNAAGGEGNSNDVESVISADGNYIAFASSATNLVPGVAQSQEEIFRKNLQTGAIDIVSTTGAGALIPESCSDPEISGDGRYVFFRTDSVEVTPADTNLKTHLFRKDMKTGNIVCVDTAADGTLASDSVSDLSSNSADGRYVTFGTDANNLVPGVTSGVHIYCKDLDTGAIVCVDTSQAGVPASGRSDDAEISPDGRYVVFDSQGSNLVPGWSGRTTYRKDLLSGSILPVATDSTGAKIGGLNIIPQVSLNGRFVTFLSSSSTPLVGLPNGTAEIFRKDMVTGALVCVSTDSNGVMANGQTTVASISWDGRYVAFLSSATNLVANDVNTYNDIFRKDLQTGAIARMSSTPAGTSGANGNDTPAISEDGHTVVFVSAANDLVPNDRLLGNEAFVWTDAPTVVNFSLPENTTVVYDFTATDPDAGTTITFSIAGGADAALFAIDPMSGVLSFVTLPNFEAPTDSGRDNVYNVTVQASDGSLPATQAVTVTITNVDEAPTIVSNGGGSASAVLVAGGTKAVTTVVASDPDFPAQTLAYSIAGGNDAAKFAINAATGTLTFISVPSFAAPSDSNADDVYNVNVQVSDGSLTATQTLSVVVTDPAGATAYVSSAWSGHASGTIVTDADLCAAGPQPAIFGVTAFADVADALTAIGSSGFVVVNAGVYAESPSLAGSVTLRLSGNVILDSIDSSVGSTLDLQANTLTTGDAEGSNTLAGLVVGPGGGLDKVGSDSLTLTNIDTYSGGTTVSVGKLLVNGSLSASSAVSVAAGATLGGTGTVGAVTSSGTVIPGFSAAGTLTTGNLAINASTLVLDLSSVTADYVVATGATVNITGTTLSLNVGTINPGETFTILTVPDAAGGLVGTFVGLDGTPGNNIITVGGTAFTINYAGGDGNDVTLEAEPIGASPRIVSTVLNDDLAYVSSSLAANQHSMVENVVYSFSQAVSLTAANFTLSGFQGTPASLVPSVVVSGSGTVWTVTFSGVGVNGATHSIGDGEYSLVLSGVAGLPTSSYEFFRLLGDMDGSGTVDTTDFTTFISTFLRASTDPLYLGADDLDGSGGIDTTDFSQFTANFLKSVPSPLPN